MAAKDYLQKKNEFLSDAAMRDFHLGSEEAGNWRVSWGHVDLEICRLWKSPGTMGESVKVAVIDTGVSSADNDLRGRISLSSISLIGGALEDQSKSHHGTMSAGLIGADGNKAGRVLGVAPGCELISLKAGNENFYPANVELALRKARELQAKIVSISIEDYHAPPPAIRRLILDCAEDGMIVLAAAGDLGTSDLSYPASCEGCISVGAYLLDEQGRRVVWPGSNHNIFVKFLAPGNNLLTCSATAAPAFYDGTSAAAAFAAGVMALAASAVGIGRIDYHRIVGCLSAGKCCDVIGDAPSPSDDQGYGVLDPSALVARLRNDT